MSKDRDKRRRSREKQKQVASLPSGKEVFARALKAYDLKKSQRLPPIDPPILGDPDAPVGAPLKPGPSLPPSAIAKPEPESDERLAILKPRRT